MPTIVRLVLLAALLLAGGCLAPEPTVSATAQQTLGVLATVPDRVPETAGGPGWVMVFHPLVLVGCVVWLHVHMAGPASWECVLAGVETLDLGMHTLRALDWWRGCGEELAYIKVGHLGRYSVEDLVARLAHNRLASGVKP